MNIHITKELADSLFSSTIARVNFGSTLYGISDKTSDVDIMCIYLPSIEEQQSSFTNHHQFQYKDAVNNIDYVFTPITQFINNIIRGDSTINFEIIQSDVLMDTPLEFLFDMRKSFIIYPVIKSYLGMAKRDLNDMYRYGNNEQEYNTALKHAYRGYIFAMSLFNNKDILPLDKEFKQALKAMKTVSKSERNNFVKSLTIKIKNLRVDLMANAPNIPKCLSKHEQFMVDYHIRDIFVKHSLKQATYHKGLMDLVYNSNLNNIKY